MRILFKFYLIIFFLFAFQTGTAQKFIEHYFDCNWKPTVGVEDASYYSMVTKTDSGWLRKDYFLNSKSNFMQMVGLYQDAETKIRNGYFITYYYGLKIKSSGSYVNNVKNGLWHRWYSNGMMEDSIHYENGKLSGSSLGWHRNGFLKDSTILDANGNGVGFAWFNDGTPSEAGRYVNFNKEGKWVYYHKDGGPSSIELYHEDSLVSFQYYDLEGKVIETTKQNNSPAIFSLDKRKWNNYVTSNLHFPSNMVIKNSDHIVVTVGATIDEEGNVVDAEVIKPFDPIFDNEALRLLKSSPKWIPAVRNNRKVQDHISINIWFGQGYE